MNITKLKKYLSFVLLLCMSLSLFTTTQVVAKEFDASLYNANDVAAMNAFINYQSNGGDAELINSPGRWQFVTWDDRTPKRIVALAFYMELHGAVDFSKLTELTYLSVRASSAITSVNVKGLNKLTELTVSSCANVKSLDLTGCTALTKIDCSDNQLTSLDVSKAPLLTELYCGNNLLKSLNVSKSPLLTELTCENNLITSLDVTGFSHLTKLTCDDNKLTTLKTSGTTSLVELTCQNNNLTSIAIYSPDFEYLDCSRNKISSLNAITGLNDENLETGFTFINFEPQNVTLTATPTASKVIVNGKTIAFDAYTINGNNYFKLRDLAKVISGTDKQFEVTWSNTEKAINLVSGMPYTPVGGELASGDGKVKTATYSTATLLIDDRIAPPIAFTIGNNNYFKLRDIMGWFNAYVGWDKETSTITIDTSMDYSD